MVCVIVCVRVSVCARCALVCIFIARAYVLPCACTYACVKCAQVRVVSNYTYVDSLRESKLVVVQAMKSLGALVTRRAQPVQHTVSCRVERQIECC